MNPCETEDLIADVFSNVMGDITPVIKKQLAHLHPDLVTPTQGRLAGILSQGKCSY